MVTKEYRGPRAPESQVMTDYNVRTFRSRWLEIARMNRQGMTDTEIAAALGMSRPRVMRILDMPQRVFAQTATELGQPWP